MKNILVTGSAGFIGANLVMRLLKDMTEGSIVGLDNLNNYYDVSLKEYRLNEIEKSVPSGKDSGRACTFQFVKGDLADKALIDNLFAEHKFDIVVNLAAQAGVRYSIENPDAYIQSNIIGFYNILEACRHAKELAQSSRVASDTEEESTRLNCPAPGQSPKESNLRDLRSSESRAQSHACMNYAEMKECRRSQDFAKQEYQGVQHLVYASSSSVYGGNKKVPFSTDDNVDHPISLYAATKKSNELFAHCYSKLYNIPTTGLRFFTVYGPAGRPDMAYFGFTNKLLKGETIQIYNYGNCRRDFTYVDDIVEGIVRVMQKAPEKKTGEDGLPVPPYAVYNIGGGQPENLLDFVQTLQEELVQAKVLPEDYDFEAHKQLVPMQPGDVPTTYADATALERDFGFTPKITLREGLRKFAEWYNEYYK